MNNDYSERIKMVFLKHIHNFSVRVDRHFCENIVHKAHFSLTLHNLFELIVEKALHKFVFKRHVPRSPLSARDKSRRSASFTTINKTSQRRERNWMNYDTSPSASIFRNVTLIYDLWRFASYSRHSRFSLIPRCTRIHSS